jgi:hypothetical protein
MRGTIVFALLSAGCPSEPPPEGELSWFATCGDPACSGYAGPFDGVPLCADEDLGGACDVEGAACDPQDDCNARWVCATEDPTVGGCPISLAKHKRDLRRWTRAERDEAAARALSVPLTTWTYAWEPQGHGAPRHLGFIIDEVGPGPWITPDGGHVDLYGYTSMTLAAVQQQAEALAAERARADALEARLVALEAQLQAR